ncbi:MAG: VanZ family protein [Chitinophagaceae bacterium]|nr:MAG: VanZ family protein [Chitinophagaceae bacterium]
MASCITIVSKHSLGCMFADIVQQMTTEAQIRRTLNRITLVIYLLALVYFVVLKGVFFYKMAFPYLGNLVGNNHSEFRNYNLIPLRTIKSSFSNETWNLPGAQFLNFVGNIILFMPLGFLLPLVFRLMEKFRNVLLATLLVSFSFEMIQLITKSGFCDIDDVLLNTVGGVFGYCFFAFLYRWEMEATTM